MNIIGSVKSHDTVKDPNKCNLLQINGVDITNQKDIANTFSSSFTSILKKYFSNMQSHRNDSFKSLQRYVSTKVTSKNTYILELSKN